MNSNQQTVRETMGKVQLIFVQKRLNGKKKEFRFTHNDKWYPMHSKWSQHLQWFRGRDYAVILTQEVPAPDSKSGSSFRIIHVLAVCDNLDELSYLNQQYWNIIKLRNSDYQKVLGTQEYAGWLREQLEEVGRGSDIYKPAEAALETCVASMTPQTKMTRDAFSTLTF